MDLGVHGEGCLGAGCIFVIKAACDTIHDEFDNLMQLYHFSICVVLFLC